MSKIKIYCIGTILFIFVGMFLMMQKNNKSEIIINDHSIIVDVADTSKKQQRGLSGKNMLCENCGMLFISSQKQEQSFIQRNKL